MSLISGGQIRAARALLGISAANLAQRAKIGHRTLQRFEGVGRDSGRQASVIAKIVTVLEAAGITFTGDPLTSPGVELKRPPIERRLGRERRHRIIT